MTNLGADALSRKHLMLSTLQAKVIKFEFLKEAYLEDRTLESSITVAVTGLKEATT